MFHSPMYFIFFQIDPNVSTFTPLDQQVKSNIKYTGNGFIPCEGWELQLFHWSRIFQYPYVLVTFPAMKTTLVDDSGNFYD